MKLKINTRDIHWWFWFVTLIFIIAALAGWTPAYYIVMAISAVQVVISLAEEKSLASFPVQIRIAYFVLTLFGLWPVVGSIIYIILLLGTVMVTFFDRCMIAMVLKYMPWNKGREFRLN